MELENLYEWSEEAKQGVIKASKDGSSTGSCCIYYSFHVASCVLSDGLASCLLVQLHILQRPLLNDPFID